MIWNKYLECPESGLIVPAADLEIFKEFEGWDQKKVFVVLAFIDGFCQLYQPQQQQLTLATKTNQYSHCKYSHRVVTRFVYYFIRIYYRCKTKQITCICEYTPNTTIKTDTPSSLYKENSKNKLHTFDFKCA